MGFGISRRILLRADTGKTGAEIQRESLYFFAMEKIKDAVI